MKVQKTMRRRAVWIAISTLAALWAAGPAAATVVVRVVGPPADPQVGQQFPVEIRADLSDPVLAWGLDLEFDPGAISLVGNPAIGPDWPDPAAAPDGDGLAGAFFPGIGAGRSGNDVLLATLLFSADALGMAEIRLSTTPTDLNEGFALDPAGFDSDVSFVSGNVTVTPEPSTALLLAAGAAVLAAGRKRR